MRTIRIVAWLNIGLLGIALSACATKYQYNLALTSEHRAVMADSLKWAYTDGLVSGVWVVSNGQPAWLRVTPKTILTVRTTAGETYRFYLQTITADESGDGLLGATISWTGYDTRQHARRTVLLREVTMVEISSDLPAELRNRAATP
jgi:hypothetical protein